MKIRKIVLWFILITLYLNIGYGLGDYFNNNIFNKSFKKASTIEKIVAGHCLFFQNSNRLHKKTTKEIKANSISTHFVFSLFWPIFIAISLVFWIAHGISWLLWFIFGGGLLRIFGIL